METVINIPSECSICLSSQKSKEKITVLSCSHSYHNNCITKWVIQNNTCPLCRSNIDMTVISPNLTTNTDNNLLYKYRKNICFCGLLIMYLLMISGVIILIIKLNK
jgi:hypothetical protein